MRRTSLVRGPVQIWCPGTEMDVVQTRQCPELKMFIPVEKSATSFSGVSASTACEKAITAGTDNNLFRLVPVIGHSARVLPLDLVPVPRHGAQIWALPRCKNLTTDVTLTSLIVIQAQPQY